MNSVNSVPMKIPSQRGDRDPAFSPSESADDLFEDFFSWRLERSPEFATQLGIEGHDGKLGKESIRNILLKIFYVHF